MAPLELQRVQILRQPLWRFMTLRFFSFPDQANGRIPDDQMLHSGFRTLKGDLEQLRRSIKLRKMDIDLNHMLSLYQEYKGILFKIEQLRHSQRAMAKTFASLRDEMEKDTAINTMTKLKDEIKLLSETSLTPIKRTLASLVPYLPNHIHPDVPIGGQDKAEIVEQCNAKPEFKFPILDHISLGEKLNLFNFSSAAQATGSGFYYLKGSAALLELGLIQYAMLKAVNKGYAPIITPDIIRNDVTDKCGYQPRSTAAQVYHLNQGNHGDLCLSGTAEIPLAGMYMNQIISLKELPIKLVAFGRCFRAECGEGQGNRGLYRVHQFSKVELFAITANEDGQESTSALEEMVSLQKEINSELGFHYRVLDMPSEELGAPAYRKYDIEAWMPGRMDYGEVTSASNCTDYQSSRLNITYSGHPVFGIGMKTRKFVHTVNGTACAIPRTIIALLENHQQEDGSVFLPAVLERFIDRKIH